MRHMRDQQSFPSPAIMSRISWPAQHLMAVARVRRRCPVTSSVVRSCSGSSVQITSSQHGLNPHVGVNAMVRGSDEPGRSVVGNVCQSKIGLVFELGLLGLGGSLVFVDQAAQDRFSANLARAGVCCGDA